MIGVGLVYLVLEFVIITVAFYSIGEAIMKDVNIVASLLVSVVFNIIRVIVIFVNVLCQDCSKNPRDCTAVLYFFVKHVK